MSASNTCSARCVFHSHPITFYFAVKYHSPHDNAYPELSGSTSQEVTSWAERFKARAKKLPARRKEIARNAIAARWVKAKGRKGGSGSGS